MAGMPHAQQRVDLRDDGKAEGVGTPPAPASESPRSTHVGNTTGAPGEGTPPLAGPLPGTTQSRQMQAAGAAAPAVRMGPFPRKVVRDSEKASPTCVDYGRLVTNAEGLYSTVLPAYAAQVTRAVLKHFPGISLRESTVLDSTANIGGDTVNFIHNFPYMRVAAVEFNRDNMPLLEHNIKALGFESRAEAIEADCLTYVAERSPEAPPFDFVYCDPPWGGPREWKHQRSMMLKLAAPEWSTRPQEPVPVYTFVAKVFGLGVSRAVVLKAPQNFDVKAFRQELIRNGHHCSISCEIVRKKARGHRPPPVAYHLYVVKAGRGDEGAGAARAAEPDEEKRREARTGPPRAARPSRADPPGHASRSLERRLAPGDDRSGSSSTRVSTARPGAWSARPRRIKVGPIPYSGRRGGCPC